MPTRREFLEKTTVMLMMIPVAAACTSNNSNPSPTNPVEGGCAIQPTSSVTNGHNHMLCVLATDLANPPSGGVTYTTTIAQSHTHDVSLTQAMLQQIAAGTTVTVTTSVSNSHTHDFMIQLAPGTNLEAGSSADAGATLEAAANGG